MSERAHNYESSLANHTKRSRGVYYTPPEIVDEIFGTIGSQRTARVCDPCCGCGNILMGALRSGFEVENIYGYDIDEEAVMIARERIERETGFDASHNILVADSLEMYGVPRFDVVVSNPPWGAKLTTQRRSELARRFGVAKSLDSSAMMLLMALERVCEGGELAFLMPDAFFNIGVFEQVRRTILDLEISHLIDFATPFKGVMSRAELVTLTKRRRGENCWAECRYDGVTHRREVASFGRNPKAIINMWTTDDEARAIEQIYAKAHTTLAKGATWGMGIVTGNNAKYCSRNPKEGDVEVVRGYNLTSQGIVDVDTYIPSDLSLYQQVAHRDFYTAPAKVIYKFISSKMLFCVDHKGRYILNSANAFIPSKELGMSCEEIAERLNSPVIGWLFRALFRTHKILRHDLEQLPLHEVFEAARYEDYLGVEPTAEGGYRVKN